MEVKAQAVIVDKAHIVDAPQVTQHLDVDPNDPRKLRTAPVLPSLDDPDQQ